jgi:subtilase family serine protease
MRRVKLVTAALAAIALLVVGAAAADASGGRSTLVGSAPSWANKGNFVGAADPSGPVGFRVYLGWRNQAGAEAAAKAVSDPKSPSYGKSLSPSAFRQQFAPTQAQVSAVQSWLQGQGFRLDYTPQNNHYVAAEGTVAQAQAAFGTAFGMYKVQGKTVRSPSGDVSIPDSLAGSVSGILGLDESTLFTHPDHVVDTNAPPPARSRPTGRSWSRPTPIQPATPTSRTRPRPPGR